MGGGFSPERAGFNDERELSKYGTDCLLQSPSLFRRTIKGWEVGSGLFRKVTLHTGPFFCVCVCFFLCA